jgi:hypothetical protein
MSAKQLNDWNAKDLEWRPVSASPVSQASSQRKSKFVRTIPLQWAKSAGVSSGRAFRVGVVLWYQAGLRSSTTFKLQPVRFDEFGIERHVAYRGLKDLERAGLVELVRVHGRAAMVTIVDSRVSRRE